jgi:hypothetical protein
MVSKISLESLDVKGLEALDALQSPVMRFLIGGFRKGKEGPTMQRTKYPLSVWVQKDDAKTYAFAIGEPDILGDEVFPKLDDRAWEFVAALPAGMEVTEVRPDDVAKAKNDTRVRCKIANRAMYISTRYIF